MANGFIIRPRQTYIYESVAAQTHSLSHMTAVKRVSEILV